MRNYIGTASSSQFEMNDYKCQVSSTREMSSETVDTGTPNTVENIRVLKGKIPKVARYFEVLDKPKRLKKTNGSQQQKENTTTDRLSGVRERATVEHEKLRGWRDECPLKSYRMSIKDYNELVALERHQIELRHTNPFVRYSICLNKQSTPEFQITVNKNAFE